MPAQPGLEQPVANRSSLAQRFRTVRRRSEELAATLPVEEQVIQSMPDASPTKWHLAHVSWFFEEFVLKPGLPGYRTFDPRFGYLFNSYYNGIGTMHPRPQRGLLGRPGVEEVRAYRAHVDEAVLELLECGPDEATAALILLGTHHEQQHQELILTDIKHALSVNPLQPAYHACQPRAASSPPAMRFLPFDEELTCIGHDGPGFCFDNETPRHRILLHPRSIASRPVTNAEYQAFIEDGGYRRPEFWLSDGWTVVQREGWTRPLYWAEDLGSAFTLMGPQPIDPGAPVCHVSYYEADAYARWADARLPLEAEWEHFARAEPIAGNLQEAGQFHPHSAAGDGVLQVWGDVWEWTASPYSAYPGFRPAAGAVGEYNGKFMCNQMVLRGGSCATPGDHLRTTYRNFFYPDARWQFTGIRLARDMERAAG